MKQLSHEKERIRSTNEELEIVKRQAGNVESVLQETNTEINFILGRNEEIKEVNAQLVQDLKVCQRHMENVLRVNRNMEEEIVLFHQANLNAIAKLQQPFTNRTNRSLPQSRSQATGGWEKQSHTDYETGDFDAGSGWAS